MVKISTPEGKAAMLAKYPELFTAALEARDIFKRYQVFLAMRPAEEKKAIANLIEVLKDFEL